MSRVKGLSLALVLVLVLVAALGAKPTRAQDEPLRIKLVINGVLGDKSFFDSAQRGMDRLIDDGYNIEVNTVELGIDPANWESGLADAMSDIENYDMLITGTFQMGEFLGARVHLYPDKVLHLSSMHRCPMTIRKSASTAATTFTRSCMRRTKARSWRVCTLAR